jgi:hypothetical protein
VLEWYVSYKSDAPATWSLIHEANALGGRQQVIKAFDKSARVGLFQGRPANWMLLIDGLPPQPGDPPQRRALAMYGDPAPQSLLDIVPFVFTERTQRWPAVPNK